MCNKKKRSMLCVRNGLDQAGSTHDAVCVLPMVEKKERQTGRFVWWCKHSLSWLLKKCTYHTVEEEEYCDAVACTFVKSG